VLLLLQPALWHFNPSTVCKVVVLSAGAAYTRPGPRLRDVQSTATITAKWDWAAASSTSWRLEPATCQASGDSPLLPVADYVGGGLHQAVGGHLAVHRRVAINLRSAERRRFAGVGTAGMSMAIDLRPSQNISRDQICQIVYKG